MFKDNRVGVFLLVVLILGTLAAIALLMFNLGQQNARLQDQNDTQGALIQELITQNRGPRGDDGLSAYEIWLSLGNTGSEEDFIESLRGERGSDGLNGQDGVSGKPGGNGASVAPPVCTGTSLEWYLTTGAHIGSTPLVCIR